MVVGSFLFVVIIVESPLEFDFEQPKINFSKHLEKQRSFQDSGTIKHSKQTEIFVSLLQFADSKRYNLPVTQQISKFYDCAFFFILSMYFRQIQRLQSR